MEIDVASLDGIDAELGRLHHRCEKQLLHTDELISELGEIDDRIRKLLPDNSDPFRLFDRRMKEHGTEWWKTGGTGYVSQEDCRRIGFRIAIVREILAEIEPDFLRHDTLPSHQLYFQPGEIYRARQEFFRLLRRASKSIDIADPYLDPDVFDFIESLEPTRAIRLLTGDPKSLFLKQLKAIQANGWSVEGRSNNQHHDRFVILDGAEVWHLGASVNGLGRKACMMNKITSATELSKVQAVF